MNRYAWRARSVRSIDLHYKSKLFMSKELPQKQFDSVSANLFYVGGNVYMVYADRLSGYSLVTMWEKDPTCNQVVCELRKYFSLFG